VKQNYSLNEFETAIEFNATMNWLGNLLAQGANRPQKRAPGAHAFRVTAGNGNFNNTQRQGMDPMVMFTQMMHEMKTQRNED
jgi:hypothetical protein